MTIGKQNNILSLPYKEVSFLRSDGHQYIDTKVLFSSSVGFDAEVASLPKTVNFFGNNGNYGGRAYRLQKQGLNYGAINTFYGTGFKWNSEEFHRVKVDPYMRKLTYDNEIDFAIPEIDFDGSGETCFLFGLNYRGDPNQLCPVMIGKFKLFSKEKLLIDLIPCVDLNGEACFYDKISNTFFRNSGSGNFEIK